MFGFTEVEINVELFVTTRLVTTNILYMPAGIEHESNFIDIGNFYPSLHFFLKSLNTVTAQCLLKSAIDSFYILI